MGPLSQNFRQQGARLVPRLGAVSESANGNGKVGPGWLVFAGAQYVPLSRESTSFVLVAQGALTRLAIAQLQVHTKQLRFFYFDPNNPEDVREMCAKQRDNHR